MIMHVEHARFTLLAIMLERDLDVGNSSETLMSGVGGGLDARPYIYGGGSSKIGTQGLPCDLGPRGILLSHVLPHNILSKRLGD